MDLIDLLQQKLQVRHWNDIVLIGYLIFVNAITLVVYSADKRAARISRRRIREKKLHILGLLGGWPAALIAMKVFRHKTRKLSFLLVFYITAGINICFFFALISVAKKFDIRFFQ